MCCRSSSSGHNINIEVIVIVIVLQQLCACKQVRQVSEVFPSIPPSVILDDLRITNSVEMTIDNIVEGRLTVTPVSYKPRSRDDLSLIHI